jgi:hypothetical protein
VAVTRDRARAHRSGRSSPICKAREPRVHLRIRCAPCEVARGAVMGKSAVRTRRSQHACRGHGTPHRVSSRSRAVWHRACSPSTEARHLPFPRRSFPSTASALWPGSRASSAALVLKTARSVDAGIAPAHLPGSSTQGVAAAEQSTRASGGTPGPIAGGAVTTAPHLIYTLSRSAKPQPHRGLWKSPLPMSRIQAGGAQSRWRMIASPPTPRPQRRSLLRFSSGPRMRSAA